MRLPDLHTLDEYRTIYREEALWHPAIDAIRARHGLSDVPCQRGPGGTHLVYYAGPSHVIKLFVPLFAQDFSAESRVASQLLGRLSITTPAITHQGEIAGWPYLVMTRVPGFPLGDVWDSIPTANRLAIVRTIGETIIELRSVRIECARDLAIDWPVFLAGQIATAAERQRDGGLAEGLASGIPAYLESAARYLAQDSEPVLLLADITSEHVFVEQQRGGWNVVGYVDFGDAFVGPPDYELVAPVLDIARGEANLLRALLLAVGYAESDLNEELRRRLMAYALIHRYVQLQELMPVIPEARRATGLEELGRVLWPL